MSTTTETRAAAWRRREALRGEVDFTMMYVGHDAFCRDLDRLLEAAAGGVLRSPEARATWAQFARMLHVHHTAEDEALWPPLEAAVTDPLDRTTLAAMNREHAELDPLVDQITTGFAEDRIDDVADDLELLSTSLRLHMQHEESAALPLLERTLGEPGWTAFGEHVRRLLGMREMSRMLPWMLDGASPEAASSVLAMLPAPVRVLERTLWSPSYRRSRVLH